MSDNYEKSDEEWKRILTPEQYKITRKKGTEHAFSGEYYHLSDDGIYHCVCCGQELFTSDTKYDSGSGWPSFWKAIDENRLKTSRDSSYGMDRLELKCGRCGCHLGHLFDDGPQPTGLRYCVNSASLKFESGKEKEKA